MREALGRISGYSAGMVARLLQLVYRFTPYNPFRPSAEPFPLSLVPFRLSAKLFRLSLVPFHLSAEPFRPSTVPFRPFAEPFRNVLQQFPFPQM